MTFNCPGCGLENEIEVPSNYKGDICIICECGCEWVENPYEDYCDQMIDQAREK